MVQGLARVRLAGAATLLGLLSATACTGPLVALRPYAGVHADDCGDRATTFTYLGAGGVLIEHRGHRVMTAPFFSNPGLLHVVLGLPIEPDEDRIRRLLPDVHDVEAILVGHAHYDHLMDARYVAEELAPAAVVYGSDTAVNILGGRPLLHGRLVGVESGSGDWWTPGAWTYTAGGTVRFMAIRSEHAPHFLGLKLFGGRVERPLERLPRTAYGWKEGQTLAFLIELLEPDGPPLRVYYQDAVPAAPAGLLPPPDSARRPVDVAILCVASFAQVADHPEAIARQLVPRHVFLVHWEDFFRSPDSAPRPVPLTDTRAFASRLTASLEPGARWHTPLRGASLRVCPSGHDQEAPTEVHLPARRAAGRH